jgi:DNA-binding transcriptional LysR family regulator
MDKASLETFIAICETGSFSKAADRLFVTQPAISKRLSSLETQMNCQLIDRIGKKASATASGEILYQHAKKLLLSMTECKTAINNLNKEVQGPLNLGISHHIGLHRLPLTLKTFANTYPKVKLNLAFIESPEAYKKIHQGELEIAMATLGHPDFDNKDEQILSKIIWKDPLCFAVSSQHPLAAKNNSETLNISDLLNTTALIPKADNATWHIIQKAFGDRTPTHSIEANSLESIRMMTTIGLGFSVLPRSMLNAQLRGLALNQPNPERFLGLLHHKSRTLSNPARAFLQVLKNCNP